jgi:hypothetical protein
MCLAKQIISNIDFSSLISAIIGGLIAGGFSLLAVSATHKNDLKKKQKQEETLLEEFLASIRVEIDTLWNRYMAGIGKTLEDLPNNQPLLFFYPVTQDYFTIYESNATLIGKIQDRDLSKLLVTTYLQAKGLIDSYRMNNELVQKFENFMFLYQQTNNSILKSQAEAVKTSLTSYADDIRKSHLEIKNNVFELLRRLKTFE